MHTNTQIKELFCMSEVVVDIYKRYVYTYTFTYTHINTHKNMHMYTRMQIKELFSMCDYVVAALPLTSETGQFNIHLAYTYKEGLTTADVLKCTKFV